MFVNRPRRLGFTISQVAILLLTACAESPINPSNPNPPDGSGALSPPWGISVSPGPSNAITIAWAPISGATQYNLYESTSPAATLETATKIAAVKSPVQRNGLVAGQTYYYRLTSTGSAGESAASATMSATTTPDLIFYSFSPGAGGAANIDAPLEISVGVTALYQLASPVTATVGGRTVTLALDAHNNWTGSASLTGLPLGPTLLTFNATNVNGSSAQAQVRFDIYPTFQVTLPPQFSVARPAIQVQAACAPVACYTIQVNGGSNIPPVIVEGSLDQAISLASLDGGVTTMEIVGRPDSLSAPSSTVSRTVWVESSTHLQDVMTVAGPIAAASPSRVMYRPSLYYNAYTPTDLSIHNAASPVDTLVFSAIGFAQYPVLTPTGAWNVAFLTLYANDDTLFVRDRGALTSEPSGHMAPVVNGDFGIFAPTDTSLTRVTLSTGARTALLPCDLAYRPGGVSQFSYGDVAANGDVVCANAYGQIFRFRNGVATQVTHDSAPLFNLLPRTDGSNIIYAKSLTSANNNTEPTGPYELALLDSMGEHILTQPMSYSPGVAPEPTYLANNGWVAYTQTSSTGEFQAWALPPGGMATQITHFGSSSTIEALGPHGEVVLLNSSTGQARRYLSVSPYSAVLDIASGQGDALFEGDSLLVFIGPTLFRVAF